jgi:hypothetical protein
LQSLPDIDDVADEVFETPLLSQIRSHVDDGRRASVVLSLDSQYVSFASSRYTSSPANNVQDRYENLCMSPCADLGPDEDVDNVTVDCQDTTPRSS